MSLSLSCLALVLPLAAEGESLLEIDWSLWIWTLATFIVMLAALNKLAFKPIAEALDRRSRTIEQSLKDAENSRAEAKRLMEDYQKQLADARTQANRIVDDARGLAENVRKELTEKANAQSAAMVQRAREEIERQKEKGIQELKDTVAGLSVQIASRVLEKEVSETTHRELVDKLIQDLGKMPRA